MNSIAVLSILVGALETAGGLQELVVQGIINNRSYPLVGGTLGTVSGLFILAAGIAALARAPRAEELARIAAAAAVSVPVFLLIGVLQPLAGLTATLLGLATPLALWWAVRRANRPQLA